MADASYGGGYESVPAPRSDVHYVTHVHHSVFPSSGQGEVHHNVFPSSGQGEVHHSVFPSSGQGEVYHSSVQGGYPYHTHTYYHHGRPAVRSSANLWWIVLFAILSVLGCVGCYYYFYSNKQW